MSLLLEKGAYGLENGPWLDLKHDWYEVFVSRNRVDGSFYVYAADPEHAEGRLRKALSFEYGTKIVDLGEVYLEALSEESLLVLKGIREVMFANSEEFLRCSSIEDRSAALGSVANTATVLYLESQAAGKLPLRE